MTWRFALLIAPLDHDDSGSDVVSTFAPVDADAPVLRVGDLSSQRGDGVFETIGVINGHAQDVGAHLDRLAHSAELCDLPAPHREQWQAAVQFAAAQCPPGECRIKLILSRGVEPDPTPTAWVTADQAADFGRVRREGIRVVTLDRGMDSGAAARAPWLLLGAKTLSYAMNMAAIREAHRRGADDAIFVSTDGFVLEGPTATVVARIDGEYVTPEPGAGILRGTTQLSLFAYLTARGDRPDYRPVPVAELARAEAVWLLSSSRLAAPVVAIDEQDVWLDSAETAAFNEFLLSPRIDG